MGVLEGFICENCNGIINLLNDKRKGQLRELSYS